MTVNGGEFLDDWILLIDEFSFYNIIHKYD